MLLARASIGLFYVVALFHHFVAVNTAYDFPGRDHRRFDRISLSEADAEGLANHRAKPATVFETGGILSGVRVIRTTNSEEREAGGLTNSSACTPVLRKTACVTARC